MGRFHDGVHEAVSRSCFCLKSSESHKFQFPNWSLSPSILGGMKKKWVSLAATYTAGKSRHHSYILIFPMREIKGWEGSSVSSWGKKDTGKVKLFLLPTLMHPILIFLLKWWIGTSLLDSWTSTKGLSSMNNCLNQCSLGKDGRKLLFHYYDVTQIWSFKCCGQSWLSRTSKSWGDKWKWEIS